MRMVKHACRNFFLSIFVTVTIMIFLSDVSVTFIEKTDPSNPLKKENYWKNTLKTFAPNGLNIAEYV